MKRKIVTLVLVSTIMLFANVCIISADTGNDVPCGIQTYSILGDLDTSL